MSHFVEMFAALSGGNVTVPSTGAVVVLPEHQGRTYAYLRNRGSVEVSIGAGAVDALSGGAGMTLIAGEAKELVPGVNLTRSRITARAVSGEGLISFAYPV